MHQNSKHINQDPTTLSWKKMSPQQQIFYWSAGATESNSWTPMGPTKDRQSRPNQLYWKFLGRSLHKVWGTTSRRAIKEGSKVVNRDWVNHQACTLSHNMYVVSSSFITNDIFNGSEKSFRPKYFLNFYTKSPENSSSGKPYLRRENQVYYVDKPMQQMHLSNLVFLEQRWKLIEKYFVFKRQN